MRRKRIRTRRRSVHALAVLLVAAGCGGGGDESAPPPPPRIDQATAERLAATSESIAELLDQGDVCTAAGRADELRAQVTEAINAGTVPARFQEDLSAKANELVNEVNCPPPPEEPEEEVGDEDDEAGGRGEKEKEKEKEEKEEDEEESEPPVEIPDPPIDPEDE